MCLQNRKLFRRSAFAHEHTTVQHELAKRNHMAIAATQCALWAIVSSAEQHPSIQDNNADMSAATLHLQNAQLDMQNTQLNVQCVHIMQLHATVHALPHMPNRLSVPLGVTSKASKQWAHTFVSLNLASMSERMFPLCSVSSASPKISAMISGSRQRLASLLSSFLPYLIQSSLRAASQHLMEVSECTHHCKSRAAEQCNIRQ